MSSFRCSWNRERPCGAFCAAATAARSRASQLMLSKKSSLTYVATGPGACWFAKSSFENFANAASKLKSPVGTAMRVGSKPSPPWGGAGPLPPALGAGMPLPPAGPTPRPPARDTGAPPRPPAGCATRAGCPLGAAPPPPPPTAAISEGLYTWKVP